MAITTSLITERFTPPSNLTDFTETQKDKWHQMISNLFDRAIEGDKETPHASPRSQFFNPSKMEAAVDLTNKVISWSGFPKKVQLRNPNDKDRWAAADADRHVQDEYCEWSVFRRAEDDKIVRVTFTCESPEYWRFLAREEPEKLLELYQTYISKEVKKEDLFKNGSYNPQNKWNRDTHKGAMHLIQENNSLGAEIELAAGASMVRKDGERIISEQQELIDWGAYGDPDRNSDPFIGAEVNALTRAGAMISLKDPVGLYFDFDEFDTTGWETPDQSDPADYWKIERGDRDTPVRIVYEVPSDRGFTVGDITINGRKIKYGAQIADFVRIKLTGIAQNFDLSNITLFGRVGYAEESDRTMRRILRTKDTEF